MIQFAFLDGIMTSRREGGGVAEAPRSASGASNGKAALSAQVNLPHCATGGI